MSVWLVKRVGNEIQNGLCGLLCVFVALSTTRVPALILPSWHELALRAVQQGQDRTLSVVLAATHGRARTWQRSAWHAIHALLCACARGCVRVCVETKVELVVGILE